jgi:hypothetical protein
LTRQSSRSRSSTLRSSRGSTLTLTSWLTSTLILLAEDSRFAAHFTRRRFLLRCSFHSPKTRASLLISLTEDSRHAARVAHRKFAPRCSSRSPTLCSRRVTSTRASIFASLSSPDERASIKPRFALVSGRASEHQASLRSRLLTSERALRSRLLTSERALRSRLLTSERASSFASFSSPDERASIKPRIALVS